MPNICTNFITITFKDEDTLNELVKNELQTYDGNKYVYNEGVNMIKKGCLGIIFEVWSANHPPYQWLERFLENYPDCWVKDEWSEEGGVAGIWIGFINIDNNEPFIQDFTWNDLSIEAKHYLFLEKNDETKE
jgi:hypothetical protein